MSNRQFAKRTVFVCLIAAAAALFVARFDDVLNLLGVVWSVLSPFLYGMMLAYVLNLVMGLWEKLWDRIFHTGPADPQLTLRRVAGYLRRPVCLILALLTVAAVIAAIVMLLSGEFKVAFASLGAGARAALNALNDFASGDPTLGGLVPAVDFDSLRDTVMGALQSVGGASGVASVAARWGGNIVHGVLDAVIAIVFALYVLAGREHFAQGAQSLGKMVLPEKWYAYLEHACVVANDNFKHFMGGQCLEACILGTLCAIGGSILGFPYAGSIGLCVGVTSLVPFIGAWVGGILGALMIASVSIEQAIMFVVFLVILQQIEGHLIYPNVVGASVSMPGIWTFFAVVVGGALFGLFGVLFGVPVVSTIRQLVLEWRASLSAREGVVSSSGASASDACMSAGEGGATSAARSAGAGAGGASTPMDDLSASDAGASAGEEAATDAE